MEEGQLLTDKDCKSQLSAHSLAAECGLSIRSLLEGVMHNDDFGGCRNQPAAFCVILMRGKARLKST